MVRSWYETGEGCPAHAGIDPSVSQFIRGVSRLPRTRGDRPSRRPAPESTGSAAPHTRGSTLRPRVPARRHRGCPAHAGIDPDARDQAHVINRAAPHTRGSTRTARDLRDPAAGCPAHAGIDPSRRTSQRSALRLPRTRGDRPSVRGAWRDLAMAAPHTRGSTYIILGNDVFTDGCPAHAGIDPTQVVEVDADPRLPRTRGDRPAPPRAYGVEGSAAPHTRGSTPDRATPSKALRGCPAHAGIDPTAPAAGSVTARLPRTRGDRPSSATRQALASSAAPHTRGSTPSLPVPAHAGGGCPAHAGIDPSRR